MPELPEVETIRRGLLKYILNKKMVGVEVSCEKSWIGPLDFAAKVTGLRRFGKALVIDFDNKKSLMVHLRMTGQMIWQGEERYAAGHPSENFTAELPNKQTRVILKFKDGNLFFNDQRKFGFIKVLDTDKVEDEPFIASLAKEPWQMTADELYEITQRHKGSPIKAVILDQKNIAGLGNIYADESLYYAKVHPKTRAGELSKKEVAMILEGARKVMTASIESGGSTMATYVKADGTKGDYLEKFAEVFRREGKKCGRCGAEIVKIRVAGRGTHICPKCQKEK